MGRGWGVPVKNKEGGLGPGTGKEKSGDKVSASPRGFLEQRLPRRGVPCCAGKARPMYLRVRSYWLSPARKSVASAQRLRKSLREHMAGPVS